MRNETSYGIIPIHKDAEGCIQFLLIQGRGRFWGFPKGHPENAETCFQTAVRELYEETGISCSSYINDVVFSDSYAITKRNILKTNHYFVGLVSNMRVIPQRGEVHDYGWFSLSKSKKYLSKDKYEILQGIINILKDST